MTTACQLVEVLLSISSKSAELARMLHPRLGLVPGVSVTQEKGEAAGKNTGFDVDFKTVADVLIQETLRHDLTVAFPGIQAGRVLGEEDGTFKDAEGNCFKLAVRDTEKETAEVLGQILKGHPDLAGKAATVVHSTAREVRLGASDAEALERQVVNVGDVGVYIDPIDGTNQYVEGIVSKAPLGCGLHASGVQVCMVLIGVFDVHTGAPLVGVVTQPFFEERDGAWTDVSYWGVVLGDFRHNNLPTVAPAALHSEKPVMLLSFRESEEVKGRVAAKYHITEAAGAGNKLVCVALGLAVGYYFSADSIYKWDTCGAHALLLSQGGEIVDSRSHEPIRYHGPSKELPGGVLAVRSIAVMDDISALLSQKRKGNDGEERAAKKASLAQKL